MSAVILLGTGGLACRTAAPSRPVSAGATQSQAAVSRGLCQNACDKYIACGGTMARNVCVEECTFIYSEDESLTSLMTMQCEGYVSYIDGPAK